VEVLLTPVAKIHGHNTQLYSVLVEYLWNTESAVSKTGSTCVSCQQDRQHLCQRESLMLE